MHYNPDEDPHLEICLLRAICNETYNEIIKNLSQHNVIKFGNESSISHLHVKIYDSEMPYLSARLISITSTCSMGIRVRETNYFYIKFRRTVDPDFDSYMKLEWKLL